MFICTILRTDIQWFWWWWWSIWILSIMTLVSFLTFHLPKKKLSSFFCHYDKDNNTGFGFIIAKRNILLESFAVVNGYKRIWTIKYSILVFFFLFFFLWLNENMEKKVTFKHYSVPNNFFFLSLSFYYQMVCIRLNYCEMWMIMK